MKKKKSKWRWLGHTIEFLADVLEVGWLIIRGLIHLIAKIFD